MTSKEALHKLKLNSVVQGEDSEMFLLDKDKEAIDIIEKDLEVLELLKPIIKASIRMSDLGISNSELSLNIKANKLLKEWLNNDR